MMSIKIFTASNVVDWSAGPSLDKLRHAHSIIASDSTRAIRELQSLASAGSPMAMVYLGGIYMNDSDRRDLAKGIYWYKMALGRGNVFVSYLLGDAYIRSNEYDKALTVLEWGAKHGYILPMWQLGMIYYYGLGVSIDIDKAKIYWESASSRGHLKSRRRIAHLNALGYYGLFGRIKSIILLIGIISDAMRIYSRDPKSDLLR